MVENKGRDKIFNYAVLAVMAVYAFITLMPLLHVLANSFSEPLAVNKGEVGLWPVRFSVESFKKVFAEESILRGYINTLEYTAVGTVIQLALQFTAAYPLSRRDLKYKPLWNIFFVLPMFVSGGLIPTFLVVQLLGMLNTVWAMIIPGCIGLFNIIIIRTYMSTAIPWEMQEAAMIDGAGNLKLFMKIVMPLCRPITAVMTLYAIVGYWNAYFNSLMYITDDKLFPLQRVLQRLLISSESGIGGSIGSGEQQMLSESLKYATIVVSSAPVLFLYPFFQRYFEKGLMVGSIKG